ncbi:hypothetical protein HU200_016224 [Digitaria exilis]|uniref:Uncharacterized protein n=1 Tax=Digitaria exilis TaxID=1010633 RepID=A0A835F9G4_9POAL|nr:hypothetical protein HU200_016224 [Digitaria exilis]
MANTLPTECGAGCISAALSPCTARVSTVTILTLLSQRRQGRRRRLHAGDGRSSPSLVPPPSLLNTSTPPSPGHPSLLHPHRCHGTVPSERRQATTTASCNIRKATSPRTEQSSAACAAAYRPAHLRPANHRGIPGVSFCNFVLANFHILKVPASLSSTTDTASRIWILYLGKGKELSVREIKNVLNFCFSIPPFRFAVEQTSSRIFSSVVANANLANYLVARGRCKLGNKSFLLFPSLGAAIAGSKLGAAADAVDVGPNPDVTFQFEKRDRETTIWAGSQSQFTGPNSSQEAVSAFAGKDFSLAQQSPLPPLFPPAAAGSMDAGDINYSSAHSPLTIEISPRTTNGCQLKDSVTPALNSANVCSASTQFATRPYLRALLSTASSPMNSAARGKPRRARSLPPTKTQCFRCLASDHLVAACRDPQEMCHVSGHFALGTSPSVEAHRVPPREANCHELGALLFLSIPLWTFVASPGTTLTHAMSLAGLPRLVIRDLVTPQQEDALTPPSPPCQVSCGPHGIAPAHPQPPPVLPSLGELLDAEEHKVSREVDSASKHRHSSRLAAKEDPFYVDATTKATRVKAAKLDLSKASERMRAALAASEISPLPSSGTWAALVVEDDDAPVV